MNNNIRINNAETRNENSINKDANRIMDKRYIEVDMSEVMLDYEKEMLAGIRIPSLLPMNILQMDNKNIMCFNTSGYVPLSEIELVSIEGMCKIIKSFVKSIIISEQYLLRGGIHFINRDMVFVDIEKNEVKLVFGKYSEKNSGFADNNIIIGFLDELKASISDNVLSKIINEIITSISSKNPKLERIELMVEDIERKWYCRSLKPVDELNVDI